MRDYDDNADGSHDKAPARRPTPGRRTLTMQLARTDAPPGARRMPSGARELDLAPAPGGLPDTLRSGIEGLSGISMDDVRVHRNSSEPASVQAAAFARGSDIHLGPGQEQHLAHEAWHVVQQKQGRVAATFQAKGGPAINDDAGLEREADLMGARALELGAHAGLAPVAAAARGGVMQLAALGGIAHIKDSCFIATIINTFAVTNSLRNLLNPNVNDLSGVGALHALQNLLHRAVNTVDASQPVGADWVMGIMTSLVANNIIAAPLAEDVNAVMQSLVTALQHDVGEAGQPGGDDAAPAYAHAAWGPDVSITDALQVDVADAGAEVTPFNAEHPANVIHIERFVGNAQQAPTSFQVQGPDEVMITYQLKSVVNRDVGSYDQSHFISYANRGNHAHPEWRENDDVGPRERQIGNHAALDQVQTDPAMILERRKRMNQLGATDEAIEKSKKLSGLLAPQPIDVRGGAAMYIYERAGMALAAAPGGGGRMVGNDAAIPDAAVFQAPYLQVMYQHRQELGPDDVTWLSKAMGKQKGFDKQIAQLKADVIGAQVAGLEKTVIDRLGIPKEQLAEVAGVTSKDLADLSVEAAQKKVLDAYRRLLKAPKASGRGGRGGSRKGVAHTATGKGAETLLAEVTRVLDVSDPKKLAALTPEDILLAAGCEDLQIRLPGARKNILEKKAAFTKRLGEAISDPATQIALAAEEREKLLAVASQLDAEAAAPQKSTRKRTEESGMPAEDDVAFDKTFELFDAESPSESELEDAPVDPEAEAQRAQARDKFSLFATATYGNHIPQPQEKQHGIDNFSGLGHSNTTAFVMRSGQFVPRLVGPALAPTPNKNAHRRALGVIDEEQAAYGDDTPHAKLHEFAAKQKAALDKSGDAPRKQKAALAETEKERRSLRHLISQGLMFSEQSKLIEDEEDAGLEAEREKIAAELPSDSLVGAFVKKHGGKREKSSGHAESQTVRTGMWKSLTDRVRGALLEEGADEEGSGDEDHEAPEVNEVGDRAIQIFLNRSSCEGCARRLVLEAIRFWTHLAEEAELDTWQAAMAAYRAQVRLEVGFSGNYFAKSPKKFMEVTTALAEAGWHLVVLGRHKATENFAKQDASTLTSLAAVAKSRSSESSVRDQIHVSERLRKQHEGSDMIAELSGLGGSKRASATKATAAAAADPRKPAEKRRRDEEDAADEVADELANDGADDLADDEAEGSDADEAAEVEDDQQAPQKFHRRYSPRSLRRGAGRGDRGGRQGGRGGRGRGGRGRDR